MWHLPQRVYKWLWSRMEVGKINKAAVCRGGLHYEVILRGFISRENESAANAPSVYLSCLNLLSSTRREQEARVSPLLHQLQPCPFLPSPWNYISYKWPCTGVFWSKHPNAWDRYVYPGQWRTAIPLGLLKSSWLHLESHQVGTGRAKHQAMMAVSPQSTLRNWKGWLSQNKWVAKDTAQDNAPLSAPEHHLYKPVR